MFVKSALLTIATFMVLPNAALAEELIHTMNCTVKSNSVTEIEEGKPKSYTGFADGFKVGEKLTFSIRLLIGEYREMFVSLNPPDSNGLFDNYLHFFRIPFSPRGNGNWSFGGGRYTAYITADSISLSTPSQNASFERYFKNDWQGIVSSFEIDMAHVYTLDCRTLTDAINDIIAAGEK